MMDLMRLHALADGEVTPAERAEIEAQLATCERSSQEYQAIVKFKRSLSGRSVDADTTELWKHCVRRLDDMDRAKTAESFVTRYAWALCSVFFLVILAGGILNRSNPDTVRTGDVARYVASLVPVPNLAPTSPNSARAFVEDAVGEPAVQLSLDRVVVTGAAQANIEGRRVVSLRLRDEMGDVALVVIPNAKHVEGTERKSDGGFAEGQIEGMNCVLWNDCGAMMMLVADRSTGELQLLASRICPKR
jgi:anti-sigma factor RsiW